MKYVIFGDIHLGLYQDSDKWLEIVLQFFKDIVLYCHSNNINQIIIGGDFFDNRKSLNTKTQHVAHRIAKVLGVKGIYTRIIVGNHDCYFKNQLHPTSLELFTKYDHIEIIDRQTIVDDILLVPWGLPIEYPDQSGDSPIYCFGHFAINGFHMNDNYICKNGMESATFTDFKLVLSSHFHTPSKQGNIVYLGAPYGQTFHDANGVRGFYTFEDGKLEFIEYTKAPKFKKIRTDNNINLSEIENNIIKLIFVEDLGSIKNQEIVDEVFNCNPFSLSIDFTKIESEDNEIQDEIVENRQQMVKSYIDSKDFPKNINKKTLLSMFNNIMEEANER